MRISEQLVAEIRRQAEQLDQLLYGEVVLKIKDGKVYHGDIKISWKAESRNDRPER